MACSVRESVGSVQGARVPFALLPFCLLVTTLPRRLAKCITWFRARQYVDPWPCHKGNESESDRRADGAKSNAATVAMSSSTILFKTAITNCRALLLYDDGWGRHAIEDYGEGWGGMSETRFGYYWGLENGVHSSESDSQFRTVQHTLHHAPTE